MLKLLETLSTLLGIVIGKKRKINLPNNLPSGEEISLKNQRVIPIENTPFATVQKDENNYVVIFGDHMITEKHFPSREEATKWTLQNDWLTFLNVVGIYVEHALKNNNLKNNNNE